jgi:hypothetical protein
MLVGIGIFIIVVAVLSFLLLLSARKQYPYAEVMVPANVGTIYLPADVVRVVARGPQGYARSVLRYDWDSSAREVADWLVQFRVRESGDIVRFLDKDKVRAIYDLRSEELTYAL